MDQEVVEGEEIVKNDQQEISSAMCLERQGDCRGIEDSQTGSLDESSIDLRTEKLNELRLQKDERLRATEKLNAPCP